MAHWGHQPRARPGAGSLGLRWSRWHSLSCLLTHGSSSLEIPEADGRASPGAKAGDADLDYEIVDRAGERTPTQGGR